MSTQSLTALSVSNIQKSFGSAHVLKGISLEAHKGDVISIIGSSGSGKSTFLRCINLLEKPTEGRIIVDGQALSLARGRDGNLESTDAGQLQRVRAKLAM